MSAESEAANMLAVYQQQLPRHAPIWSVLQAWRCLVPALDSDSGEAASGSGESASITRHSWMVVWPHWSSTSCNAARIAEPELLSDLSHVLRYEQIHLGTRSFRVPGEVEQAADGVQREAELATAANERETAEVALVVDPVAPFGPRSHSEQPDLLSPGTALARLGIATPYIAWNLTGIMSVAFFVSSRSTSPLYAVATGLGLTVISQILDSFSAMGDVRRALPMHSNSAWEGLFASPANWDDVVSGVALQVPYVVVFLSLAFWSFHRRDILT